MFKRNNGVTLNSLLMLSLDKNICLSLRAYQKIRTPQARAFIKNTNVSSHSSVGLTSKTRCPQVRHLGGSAGFLGGQSCGPHWAEGGEHTARHSLHPHGPLYEAPIPPAGEELLRPHHLSKAPPFSTYVQH